MWLTLTPLARTIWRKPTAKSFIIGLAAGLGLTLLIGSWLHSKRNDAEIALQNALAALDTTRLIAVGETKKGAERELVWARRMAQNGVELNAVLGRAAKASRLTPVLVAPVVAVPVATDTNIAARSAAAAWSGDTIIVRDTLVINAPSAQAEVAIEVLVPSRDSASVSWHATLEPRPVPLTLSAGCGEGGPELLASGPDWIEIEISPGVVDPSVCNGKKSNLSKGAALGALGLAALVAVVKLVF